MKAAPDLTRPGTALLSLRSLWRATELANTKVKGKDQPPVNNDIVPYSDGREVVTRKARRQLAGARDAAVVNHQARLAGQNSDAELRSLRHNQAYTMLDVAMMRSAASQRLARDLSKDDPELGMVLGAMKQGVDGGVAYSIAKFAQGS